MRFGSIAIPLLVGVALIFSLISVLWPEPERVGPEAWQAAEKLMAENGADRELVIIHPAWEDGALDFFKQHYVILGKPNHHGFKNYTRIWVILAHGASKPDYITDMMPNFDREVEGLRLLRYIVPDANRILYDFYAHIQDATVQSIHGKETLPCDKWRIMRWWCPKRDWNHVGHRAALIQNEWVSCIWHHPLKGRITRATWHNVPMGHRIVGELALTDEAVDRHINKPVHVEVRIDGQSVLKIDSQEVYGFVPFDIDTRKFKQKTATIDFDVSAEVDGMRHFCWRARVRSDDPGEPRFRQPPPVEIPEKNKPKKKESDENKERLK